MRMTATCWSDLLTSCEVLNSRYGEVLVETLDRAGITTIGDARKVM